MKKIPFVFSLVLLLVAWTTLAKTALCHESHDIKFGVFPYKSPRTIAKLFAPLVKRLEKELDIRVHLVTAPDFPTYVARARQGEYDLALPCINCFYETRNAGAGYTVIARGEPSFCGRVLVRRDSGIDGIEQLKGRRIAAIGPHSYAGYLFLFEQLMDKGIDANKEVDFYFLGKVDSVIYGVINGQYAAGVIRCDSPKNPVFWKFTQELKFISVSDPIPQFPFVVSKDMSAERTEKIRQVLTSLSADDPDDKNILESLHIRRIEPATDIDYKPFRQTLHRALELAR